MNKRSILFSSMTLIASLVLTSICTNADETTTPSLIKNGENPTITTTGDQTVYTYSNLVVTTVKGMEGDGIVFHPNGGEMFEFCGTDMDAYFYGFNGSVAFVTSGSGLFPTLTGFNIKSMDMDPYEDFVIPQGGAEVDGSKLIVWRVMEYPSPAAESAAGDKAAKLESKDLRVFYTQKFIHDYSTNKTSKFEEYDCVGIE